LYAPRVHAATGIAALYWAGLSLVHIVSLAVLARVLSCAACIIGLAAALVVVLLPFVLAFSWLGPCRRVVVVVVVSCLEVVGMFGLVHVFPGALAGLLVALDAPLRTAAPCMLHVAVNLLWAVRSLCTVLVVTLIVLGRAPARACMRVFDRMKCVCEAGG
jgi:hypothetical protein